MKIDEMKNSFISILQTSLDANGKEEVRLSEKILEENGLNQNTFWEVICPSLQAEGLLKEYNDPNTPLSEYRQAVLNNQEYENGSRILRILIELSRDGIPNI